MKYELPPQHSLSEDILADNQLLPREDDASPSLTDIQFDALDAGVARGESALVVAPTSTGKTLIGIWAILSWLRSGGGLAKSTVYLVTHRALARQKFQEFSSLLLEKEFGNDQTALVLANGDTIEDAGGGVPEDPLSAPLIVATYEKYLALLAASGVSARADETLVVCDEIQIIGDENRGKNVEILLTMMKSVGWGQFVGLSAVITAKDATDLSSWLEVKLVRTEHREKQLVYECRTPQRVLTYNTGKADEGPTQRPRDPNEGYDTEGILQELAQDEENFPVVVFCMNRQRVFDGARTQGGNQHRTAEETPLLPGLTEDTLAARELSRLVDSHVGFHAADLLDDERELVEQRLRDGDLKVVFATTTLAAGVNFPFRTAVFDHWERFDGTRSKPIPNSEFQNMAGRVGRMGFEHEDGRVIFKCDGSYRQRQAATVYLQPDKITELTPRIQPMHFSQICLQLIASEICGSIDALHEFIAGTFSAQRELEKNQSGLAHWQAAITEAIDEIRDAGFVS